MFSTKPFNNLPTTLEQSSPQPLLDFCSGLAIDFNANPADAQDLIKKIIRKAGDQSAAIFYVLAEIVDDDSAARRLSTLAKLNSKKLPDWIYDLREAKVSDTAFEASTFSGDTHHLLAELDIPHAPPVTMSLAADMHNGACVKDFVLLPNNLAAVKKDMQEDDTYEEIKPLALQDLATGLHNTLRIEDMQAYPEPSGQWPRTRPLLHWILGLLPEPKTYDTATPEEIAAAYEEEDKEFARREHLAEKLLKEFREEFNLNAEDTYRMESVLYAATNYGTCDPLRWSATRVQRILYRMFNNMSLDDEQMRGVPAVLKKFIAWVGKKHGTPDRIITAAVESVDGEFEELRIYFAKISAEVTYEEQFAYSRRPLDIRPLLLGEVDAQPLPLKEPMDYGHIPYNVQTTATHCLAVIENFFADHPDEDPELRVVARRLLSYTAQRKPSFLLDKRSSPERQAGTLIAVAKDINGYHRHYAEIAKALGLRSPLDRKVRSFSSFLGSDLDYLFDNAHGLLTSTTRAGVIDAR
ncbi:hypothetical protein CPHO_12090 [Corynebacterium phocae]|uniref:Uncharacterized protein n=1 Tax=Corynebacterium phocae TaxID=161895 RepID=A0A1L7D5W8_9CORY|nr:hypothetical protein [Corynebacterium phocae]APT93510.1 hypothetical protein CPHO_12090 [Corynebacterium phocae]KAA8720590.1 hypothetical protein F4V58_11535 [Corynebacterium phocae]